MKIELRDPQILIVIQFGSTREEQYLHSFYNEGEAKRFVRRARRASYRCIGPFGVALPELGDLACAAKAVVCSAKRKRGRSQHVRRLARSLAAVRKEFRLR